MLLVASMASSVHCVGMCGPIVISIGALAPTPANNLTRQLFHASGRTFTYVWLGAFAAFAGHQMATRLEPIANIQGLLGLLAGSILIFQGLRSVGCLPQRLVAPGSSCIAEFGLGSLFRAGDRRGAFLAGIATGFLPCGLVWGFLGIAAAAGDIFNGAAVMLALGLGTFPAMIATGCGAALISKRIRSSLNYAAGCCLLIAGEVTLTRAVSVFAPTAAVDGLSCPLHGRSNLDKLPISVNEN